MHRARTLVWVATMTLLLALISGANAVGPLTVSMTAGTVLDGVSTVSFSGVEVVTGTTAHLRERIVTDGLLSSPQGFPSAATRRGAVRIGGA